MALNLDREIVRHQQGWAGFCKFLMFSCIGIAIILGLMAIFLL